MARGVRVIGVGNELRGDDAAGLEVARRLSARDLPRGVEVLAHEGQAVTLLDLWSGADTVLLVDTIRSGAPPGTFHRIDASREPLPARLGSASSHTVSVGAAIELGRALHRLPHAIVVFGVEGCRFDAGSALSPQVAQTLEPLADAVGEAARRAATRQP